LEELLGQLTHLYRKRYIPSSGRYETALLFVHSSPPPRIPRDTLFPLLQRDVSYQARVVCRSSSSSSSSSRSSSINLSKKKMIPPLHCAFTLPNAPIHLNPCCCCLHRCGRCCSDRPAPKVMSRASSQTSPSPCSVFSKPLDAAAAAAAAHRAADSSTVFSATSPIISPTVSSFRRSCSGLCFGGRCSCAHVLSGAVYP
jgi:hypothetical protein